MSEHSKPLPLPNIRDLLSPRVRETIDARGFQEFSAAQLQAIPPVLAGEHVCLIAPTGTGKTESAMIPVFDRLLAAPKGGFRALYITPLRSLNRDILDRMSWWGKELGLSVGVRHGDTTQAVRRRQSLTPPDLLITTPETLQALFMGSQLRRHLKNVRFVIIDEIHELADSKRGSQLAIALERLSEYAGDFQRIGLSATVGNPEEVGRFFCGNRPFSLIEIPAAPHLDIAVRYAGEEFSGQAKNVARCLDAHASTLVFVNTRVTAEALGHALFERGDVEVHHGSLSKEVRVDAEDRFKQGKVRGLICTSSMELGIDIGHVEHVVQFGSPRVVSRIIQRVGRAGHRLHEISRGTILATGFDDLLESLVIARRALHSECEPVVLHTNAADVLANQVAAMAVEYGEISRERIARIIGRSSVFPASGDLLEKVCAQLARHHLVWYEHGIVRRKARARKYLAATLSMIHDEKKMIVFDIASRRAVGTLDESFVVGGIETGAVFITKGQLWRVLELSGDRVMVEPARHAKGELPSWEGEQIPVPFSVADEVGQLRRIRDFIGYTDDCASLTYLRTFLAGVDGARRTVPTDDCITLENAPEGVICNICAGSKANEALARVLSVLLSARFGTTVGIEVGAYRFLLRLPRQVKGADVRDVLHGIEPAHVDGILRLALKRTALFRWKLLQIAKKFGAIDPDADYERISMPRLLETFDGTVVQDEAYRELLMDYMDAGGAAEVIARIRSGAVRIESGPLSPLGSIGLFSSRDMIPPAGSDAAVLGVLRRRLLGDRVLLFCMHCRSWKSRTVVEHVADHPRCPKCSAGLIAALKPWEEDLVAMVSRRKLGKEERAVEQRLLRNANIVLSSGKKAVIALAARGVGPEAASRILATQAEGDPFYREILRAESQYVRTHRFWQGTVPSA